MGKDAKFRTINLDEQKRDACTAKNGYDTPEDAINRFAIDMDEWNYHRGKYDQKTKVNVYECKFCSKWHIGHDSTLIKKCDDLSSRLNKITWLDFIKSKLKR